MGKLWLRFRGFSRLDRGSQNMCSYPKPQNPKVLPYVAKVLGPKKRGSSCRNSAATHILVKKMEEKTSGKGGCCRRPGCSDVVPNQEFLEPPETEGHKVPVLPSGLQRESGLPDTLTLASAPQKHESIPIYSFKAPSLWQCSDVKRPLDSEDLVFQSLTTPYDLFPSRRIVWLMHQMVGNRLKG